MYNNERSSVSDNGIYSLVKKGLKGTDEKYMNESLIRPRFSDKKQY
jgi:hypothetical protein